MRFTQSISLSNIQSLHMEGPALRRLKPAGPEIKHLASLFPNRRRFATAAIRKQLLIFWWS
jgi:hypothetical protein